jgi:hypothetical protein
MKIAKIDNRRLSLTSLEIQLSKQKDGKRQKQELVQKEKRADSKNAQKLVERLDELKKKGKYCDVAVCPRCKSINLRRVNSMTGDMSGHLAWLPAIFECLDCGWRGRLEIFATNKGQTWKEIAIMLEARDVEKEEAANK